MSKLRILNHYHKIFFFRFLSYFFILIGAVTIILIVEPVLLEEIKYDMAISGQKTVLPKIITSDQIRSDPGGVIPEITPSQSPVNSGSGIVPVSTDFGVVIEKINANAKVIPDVDPSNEKEYMKALAEGIAQAKGTANPGEKGNIYLFSHSVNAPWDAVRYNAVFYLLNKLEVGDKIILFYKGKRFDYVVFDKTVAGATETNFLTQNYDQSILTLQTCDPPGTAINRLLVRAKLEGV